MPTGYRTDKTEPIPDRRQPIHGLNEGSFYGVDYVRNLERAFPLDPGEAAEYDTAAAIGGAEVEVIPIDSFGRVVSAYNANVANRVLNVVNAAGDVLHQQTVNALSWAVLDIAALTWRGIVEVYWDAAPGAGSVVIAVPMER